MARRRPADADMGVAEDTLPLLSTSSTDLGTAKRRTPTEKAGRFFRTRPVSSMLIIIALCAVAMLTFSIGRTVGTAISTLFSSSSSKRTASEATVLVPHTANRTRQHPPGVDDDNDDDKDDDKDEDGDNDKADGPAGDDEKGPLVDGVTENHPAFVDPKSASAAAQVPAEPAISHICHRKFEPGKLGWNKMLCITDEFFFDISIGKDPVGTFKIGVFGEVVPKSAANFRALATCSGVFADDSLCYRGDGFHRVVSNFVAQGGSKATGRSIYGPTFREEKEKDHHSFLQHAEKGVVSWAEYPIGSQFFMLVRSEATYLDVNHVVFGIITEGLDVLDKIHDAPRNQEEPTSRITITNCGDAHKTL